MVHKILKEEIQVNHIFVGKYAWMFDAMEAGTDWDERNKYRVSAVTNKFVMLVDKRGRETTHPIDSKAAWQRFYQEYAFLRPMQLEDCYFNEKAGVYSIILDGWISRKGSGFGVYGYQVKFDYKGYNFNLFWIADVHLRDEKLPFYMKKIKEHSMGSNAKGAWYLSCKSTYKEGLEPMSYDKKTEDRVVKFMLFLYNHFDFKYTMKLKDYQMKQPLILLH
mgnify:CR=1 FL=1